jgi:hypothetical protein
LAEMEQEIATARSKMESQEADIIELEKELAAAQQELMSSLNQSHEEISQLQEGTLAAIQHRENEVRNG